jgi:hypothetical protein
VSLSPGTGLGPYELTGLVGVGGMGEVASGDPAEGCGSAWRSIPLVRH